MPFKLKRHGLGVAGWRGGRSHAGGGGNRRGRLGLALAPAVDRQLRRKFRRVFVKAETKLPVRHELRSRWAGSRRAIPYCMLLLGLMFQKWLVSAQRGTRTEPIFADTSHRLSHTFPKPSQHAFCTAKPRKRHPT